MRCRYAGLVLGDWSLQENSFLWSDGNLSGICLCHSWQIWKAAQGILAKRAEVALSSCTPTLPSSTPSGPAFFDTQPGLELSSELSTTNQAFLLKLWELVRVRFSGNYNICHYITIFPLISQACLKRSYYCIGKFGNMLRFDYVCKANCFTPLRKAP